MEPKASYLYRIMCDIHRHRVSTINERARRTKISPSFTHRTIVYLKDLEHVLISHKNEVFLTQKGEKAKQALETLSKLVK